MRRQSENATIASCIRESVGCIRALRELSPGQRSAARKSEWKSLRTAIGVASATKQLRGERWKEPLIICMSASDSLTRSIGRRRRPMSGPALPPPPPATCCTPQSAPVLRGLDSARGARISLPLAAHDLRRGPLGQVRRVGVSRAADPPPPKTTSVSFECEHYRPRDFAKHNGVGALCSCSVAAN